MTVTTDAGKPVGIPTAPSEDRNRQDQASNAEIEKTEADLNPRSSRSPSIQTSKESRIQEEDTIQSSTKADGGAVNDGNGSAIPVDVETIAGRASAEDEPPPEGGYGWVCVAATAGIAAHSWGLNSTYAVFLAHYLTSNTFPFASSLDFALIGGLSIGVALLISPFATWLLHLWGTRPVLFLGNATFLLSFLSSSFIQPGQLWPLFLSQGVCFGCGLGLLFVGSVGIIPQWFVKRRGLASGFATAGSGLGGLIYSFTAQALIRRVGLAWCFRVLGIIVTVVNVVCTLLLRDRHAEFKSSFAPFAWRYFTRPEYLVFLLFGVFSMLGYVVLLFSMPSHARSLGYSAGQGSTLGAILNLGQMVGRPAIGLVSDSIGRINMAVAATAMCGVLVLVWWLPSTSYGALVTFSLFGGMLAGAFWVAATPVGAEVVGVQDLPAALNILWIVTGPPAIASEVIGLELVNANGGSYRGAQLFTGFMYIGGALCAWVLRAWKIRELRRLARAKQVPVEEINPIQMDVKHDGKLASEKENGVTGDAMTDRPGLNRESVLDEADKDDSFIRLLFAWCKV